MQNPAQKTRPRVCFLVGGREGGGMAVATRDLIRGISRDRFDVTVVTCGDGPFSARLTDDGETCQNMGTGWPPMLRRNVEGGVAFERGGAVRMIGWTVRTVRTLSTFLRTHAIDLLHTNYYHFHAVAAMAGAASGTTCLWHWRGRIDHPVRVAATAGSASTTLKMTPTWKWLVRFSPFLRALTRNHVWSIAVSDAVAESVRPLVGDRLSVIRDGVVLRAPGTAGLNLRKVLSLPNSARIVGLVATFNPVKGHRHFVEAAAAVCAKCPDAHFVHIGGQTGAGQDEYRQGILRRAAELRLDGKFHFLGHRDDAIALTAEFDVAVNCTLPPGEGFPLTVLEAMAAGVPVVASNCGGSTESVAHEHTGLLVAPADSDALAGGILRLLTNDRLRRELGENARQRCITEFSAEQTIARIESLYVRLLDRG